MAAMAAMAACAVDAQGNHLLGANGMAGEGPGRARGVRRAGTRAFSRRPDASGALHRHSCFNGTNATAGPTESPSEFCNSVSSQCVL